MFIRDFDWLGVFDQRLDLQMMRQNRSPAKYATILNILTFPASELLTYSPILLFLFRRSLPLRRVCISVYKSSFLSPTHNEIIQGTLVQYERPWPRQAH